MKFDVPETTFEFEETDDAAAALRFAHIAAQPQNAWDYMRVICIDKPAVAEITHHVAENENMTRYSK